MPIGIVSQNDIEKELEKPMPMNGRVEKLPTSGRKEGDVAVPDEVKKFIAEAAITSSATGKELADLMQVSESSVSAYKNGANSTASYNKPSPAIANHILSVKDKISKKAQRVLRGSLNSITEDKLNGIKAKDAAIIARQMAGIIKDMEPDTPMVPQDNRVQFIMFAPAMKRESDFDAIDVQALDAE